MLFKRKKVYVVTGMTWENNGDWAPEVSYPTFPTRMVFNSYAKARAYIDEIMEDVIEEAVEMDYELEDIKYHDEQDTLEIKFATGTIENWIITEREVL